MLYLLSFADAASLAYVEGVHNGRLLDDPAMVDACHTSYTLALSDAAAREESVALLRSIANMHSTEPAIADRIAPSAWRKSSYSGGANADCLEVADGHATVPVRDSKAADGPAVVLSADGWSSFVTAIKDGHLSS